MATTLRADLDAALTVSFEDRVQAVVEAFVRELVPLLRESVVQQIRDALGIVEQSTAATDEPAAAPPKRWAERRRRN